MPVYRQSRDRSLRGDDGRGVYRALAGVRATPGGLTLALRRPGAMVVSPRVPERIPWPCTRPRSPFPSLSLPKSTVRPPRAASPAARTSRDRGSGAADRAGWPARTGANSRGPRRPGLGLRPRRSPCASSMRCGRGSRDRARSRHIRSAPMRRWGALLRRGSSPLRRDGAPFARVPWGITASARTFSTKRRRLTRRGRTMREVQDARSDIAGSHPDNLFVKPPIGPKERPLQRHP